MRESEKNYREGRFALTELRARHPFSCLNHSNHYFDFFHGGNAGAWRAMEQHMPDELQRVFTQIPVPRTQTVPQLTTPDNVTRWPYHMNPPRAVDPEVARRLNSELQDGTHPTTEALVPLGLRYLRILGAGSQGTAVLFEMDDADGTTKKVVAKYDTSEEDDGEEGLLKEKEWMRVSESGQNIQ